MEKIFIYLGIAFLAIGLILYFMPWMLGWFGKLPGDIDYRGENIRVFIPITSMIIVSIAISLIIRFFR
jgi:hypothetical protein